MLMKSNIVVIKSDGEGKRLVKKTAEKKIMRHIIKVIRRTGKNMVKGCFLLTSRSFSPLSVRNLSQFPCVIIARSSVSIFIPSFFFL